MKIKFQVIRCRPGYRTFEEVPDGDPFPTEEEAITHVEDRLSDMADLLGAPPSSEIRKRYYVND